jgi:predicted DNA-binding transcriptional regulator
MLVASIIGIILYGWLLFFVAPQLVLQISAYIAVIAILGILAWIGYTMASTPPPKPIEDFTSSKPETPSTSATETQDKASSQE